MIKSRICIVIPAYNEEKRIGNTLEEYAKFFREKKKSKEINQVEFLIVLNGCKDNTLKVVQKYKKRFKEISFLNFQQAGKGFAITEGFKEAIKNNFDFIGFLDADMSTPPNAFYGLIRHIKKSDGIIANRREKQSIITPKQTLFRRFIGITFNFIVRTLFLFPHKDTQCGAKLFKRESLIKFVDKLGASEWSFDVDLLFYARRTGAKVKSIPTIWADRDGSHVNLRKTPFTMLISVLRLRMVHSPFKILIRMYKALPKKVQFKR